MPVRNLEYLGIQIPVNITPPACFVFGVWKSGSTLLNEAVRFLAQRNRSNWVSIPDQLFLSNIDLVGGYANHIPDRLVQPGNVYGGFRIFPRSLSANPVFRNGFKVLMVRDPRDALVSQYYSFLKSHCLPDGNDNEGPRRDLVSIRHEVGQVSIDDFAISRAPAMNEAMLSYCQLLSQDSLLLLRYEDAVYRKSEMLTLVCDHFSWELDDQGRRDILHHIDVVPNFEDPSLFIRRVTPGDHIEKLQATTIGVINNLLAESMALYGYAA